VLRAEVVREGDTLFAQGGEFCASLGNDRILVLLLLYGFVFVGHYFFLLKAALNSEVFYGLGGMVFSRVVLI
jgi:hypothetical protein